MDDLKRCMEAGLRAPHGTLRGLHIALHSWRRTVKRGLQGQVLEALAREAIEIALPTLILIHDTAERTWKENT